MSPTPWREILLGGHVVAGLAIAVFFLRFWRETRDRLFALFSSAFGLMALNWLVLAVIQPSQELRHYVYAMRLIAFGLIIAAILDKNRISRPK